MQAVRFRPNVQVYTCLVQACILDRRLDKALTLHETRLADEGCKVDNKFYAVLARGCLQLHQPLKAVEVVRAAFDAAAAASSEVDPTFATALLDAMSDTGAVASNSSEAPSKVASSVHAIISAGSDGTLDPHVAARSAELVESATLQPRLRAASR